MLMSAGFLGLCCWSQTATEWAAVRVSGVLSDSRAASSADTPVLDKRRLAVAFQPAALHHPAGPGPHASATHRALSDGIHQIAAAAGIDQWRGQSLAADQRLG